MGAGGLATGKCVFELGPFRSICQHTAGDNLRDERLAFEFIALLKIFLHAIAQSQQGSADPQCPLEHPALHSRSVVSADPVVRIRY